MIDTNDQNEYERHVRTDPHVERLTDLDGGVDRTLHRIELIAADELDGFLDALRKNAVIVEDARGGSAEWVFHLRGDIQEARSAF